MARRGTSRSVLEGSVHWSALVESRASGNPAIRAALDTLVNARHRHYAAGTDEITTARTNAAHQVIYDAIARGDAEAARVAMTEHLAVVRSGLRQDWPATITDAPD